jgi:hypothetical protein
MIELAEVSGLSDADPIYPCLQATDKIIAQLRIRSWFEMHRAIPVMGLLDHMFANLRMQDNAKEINRFVFWLRGYGEYKLAEVIIEMYKSGMSARMLRLVLLYMVVNFGLLKEKELRGRKYRSLDDEWMEGPSTALPWEDKEYNGRMESDSRQVSGD